MEPDCKSVDDLIVRLREKAWPGVFPNIVEAEHILREAMPKMLAEAKREGFVEGHQEGWLDSLAGEKWNRKDASLKAARRYGGKT